MGFTNTLILCLIYTTGLINGESLYYKVPKTHDPSTEIRGNSFGLENFLLQAYKETDTTNKNSPSPGQVTGRSTAKRKERPNGNRGQTYGLENLTPNFYDLGSAQSNIPQYITDFQPIVEPKPETVLDLDTNRQRNKDVSVRKHTRKQVKQQRKPITVIPKVTEPHVSTEIYIPQITENVQNDEPQDNTKTQTPQIINILTNSDIEINREIPKTPVDNGFTESNIVSDSTLSINETATQMAEASYQAPKIQEIPISEKEFYPSGKQHQQTQKLQAHEQHQHEQQSEKISTQQPEPQSEKPEHTLQQEQQPQQQRKRLTMRRRKKRPNPASQDGEKITPITELVQNNESNDIYDAPSGNEDVSITTTPSTSTTTHKERSTRKRPSGFRRVNHPIHVPENRPQLEIRSEIAVPDIFPEIKDTDAPTTDYAELNKPSVDNAYNSSSDKTSASDLKTILKQQNGPLSLSEILQTQNLSLADFLKNRKEAALLLSGKKATVSTTQRSDTRNHNRPLFANFSTRSRPFSKNKQESEEYEETRPNERDKAAGSNQSEKSNYNGFVPKNPRQRLSQFKSVSPSGKPTRKYEVESTTTDNQESKYGKLNVGSDNPIVLNGTRHQINTTKRFNDLRVKLRMHRRKHPILTTSRYNKEEKVETTTSQNSFITITPAKDEKPNTTEETTKRINLRTPFKSSNNPELSVILPNKNKGVEKTEKRERHSNYSSRIQTLKKGHRGKEEPKRKDTENVSPVIPPRSTEPFENFPLDLIEMDDSKEDNLEMHTTETLKIPVEENVKSIENKRVDVVAKIPLPNESLKYDSKDEILELLKTGTHSSDRLHKILESRNMTVKELLENREKSSMQSNFPQLFGENEVRFNKGNGLKETESNELSTIKVFQSLPNFQSMHKNMFQKEVKDVKSNNYGEHKDETRKDGARSSANLTDSEARDAKQLGNRIIEVVKRKLHVNSDSESRKPFGSNDGIDQWNNDDKFLFFSNTFPVIKEKPASNSIFKQKNYLIQGNTADIEENDIILLETIKKSQEANRKLKNNINEILKEQSNIKDTSNKDKSLIPPAIKSAIIASGVVMGLALLVFVIIFAACGWKQRRIRLRARSSIFNDTLANSGSDKKIHPTTALSPVNFKQPSIYKKSLDLDDGSSSASGASNTSSYLWNTLKNTFSGRNTMLKSKLEKDDKTREERLDGLKNVLKNYENRKSDILVEEDGNEDIYPSSFRSQEERYSVKDDCMKRNSSFKINHYSNCTHGH